MLAIGMLPRVRALRPWASGACATNGEFHALDVCTGTMIVWPSTVTALWSDGPAPPRRLATPPFGDAGSASRNPKDCSSVISWRVCGDSARVGSVVVVMGRAPERVVGHRRGGERGAVVD